MCKLEKEQQPKGGKDREAYITPTITSYKVIANDKVSVCVCVCVISLHSSLSILSLSPPLLSLSLSQILFEVDLSHPDANKRLLRMKMMDIEVVNGEGILTLLSFSSVRDKSVMIIKTSTYSGLCVYVCVCVCMCVCGCVCVYSTYS